MEVTRKEGYMSKEASIHFPMTRALVVSADVSRWGEPMRTSAEQVWTKVSQKDTNGAWSMFESLVPAGFGVPLHKHHSQEEWFWILTGQFLFEVGGELYNLGPGMSILAPRQIPHRWMKNTESDGRMLILVQPSAGMEIFFERLAALSKEQVQDAAVINRIFSDCDMEVLGAPLDESVR
jgi:quercetin dioxygenase-like cupin family protein